MSTSSSTKADAKRAIKLTPTTLWRIRLAQRLPRYLLYAVASAGLIASLRFAIAPPGEGRPEGLRSNLPVVDRAAEGYAVFFARRYLSWNAAEPQGSQRLLAPIVGVEMAPTAGMTLPAVGSQNVEWAEVVQSRELERGKHVYTVAAQVRGLGILYLAVDVARSSDGRLMLWGYPAFVGAPSSAEAHIVETGAVVGDRALNEVIKRALRNYLGRWSENLDADLSPGARVGQSSVALTLEAVQRIAWSGDRRSVLATVEAQDARGTRYTLDYELDVIDAGGRWEISAIEVDPEQ
ncbi:MAG TPA: conjugal transfer protein [Solirubrobacteraceae bacterium]|nr:conjugal transfer protein [Solirubrobacteraceae bacterium]